MAAGTAAVVLLSATLAGAAPPPATAAAEDPRQAAAAALRGFSAVDLDGRQWTPASLHGRVVLFDFWATWCAPCLAELPRLKDLYARHPRSAFEILGISLDALDRRAFVSWLRRNRIAWPQFHDRAAYNGALPRLFGIDRLPRTVLLAQDGTIAAVDVRGERLTLLVDELVAGARLSGSGGGER